MYYIIALSNTMKHEEYITLWRPNNAGYCFSKEMAGEYSEPKPGYHDSDLNMPILITEADKLFCVLPYDGVMKLMIPNNKAVWQQLGVKMTNDGLVKIKKK